MRNQKTIRLWMPRLGTDRIIKKLNLALLQKTCSMKPISNKYKHLIFQQIFTEQIFYPDTAC